MFLILFWWLGNPWKPITASGQSFFKQPFRAINLRSSLDSWCFLCSQLYWTISSIHWHWQRFLSHLHPRYIGKCDRCASSRMSSHLPGWVAAGMNYLCWDDIQLGYLKLETFWNMRRTFKCLMLVFQINFSHMFWYISFLFSLPLGVSSACTSHFPDIGIIKA